MDILVIGGIAAGASVANKAKRTNPDANITIIEKENYVSFGACGLPYYVGRQFTDASIMYARSVEETESKGINVLLNHEAKDIDFEKNEVKVYDLKNDEEKTLKYDKLAICTGATPNIFGDGSDAKNIFKMTNERDANKLLEKLDDYKDIVIVGAGFIGLEMADQLAELGKKVKVVHRDSSVMENVFDEEIRQMLIKAAEEKGVEFLFEHSYESFVTEDGIAKEIVTDKGNIKLDCAILALGFKPNTTFIKDEKLQKLKNGAIIIDKTGKTSIDNVYAAGDCASVYHQILGKEFYSALATYANKMGRLVGENIVTNNQKEYIGALGASSIKIGDYGAASVGLTEDKAKDMDLAYKTSFIKSKNQSGYIKGQEDIYIKLVYLEDSKKIIGGQIFGKKGAVERSTALVVAIHKEVTVEELAFMDFPYSPGFAPTWDPLNIAGSASK